jgi:hypothetical protein
MSKQIEEIKSKFDLKLIIIIGLAILCAGMFIFGFNNSLNFKKEKRELDAKINMYKHIDDSLANVAKLKVDEYAILEINFKQDSLRLDSLEGEFYDASDNARQSEKTASYYRGKYTDAKNKIVYLESHMVNIKGDSLLISLSKKIN